MTVDAYKNLVKTITLNYPRLRAGEYSAPFATNLSKVFKMPIDAETFSLVSLANKDYLESWGKKLNLIEIIDNNLSFVEKKCGDLPIEDIIKQKIFTKLDWAFIFYLVFSEPTLSNEVTKKLPEKIQKLWAAMVWSAELSPMQVEEITGEYPILNLGRSTNYYAKDILQISPDYKTFATEFSDYNHNSTFTFSLPAMVRMLQKPYFDAPKEVTFQPIAELGSELTIFESELLAIQDIARVLAYRSQDNIKTTTTGKATVSTLNKMRKMLSIQEYYEDDKELESLRAHCLGNLILYVPMKQVSVGTAQVDILKSIVQRFERNQLRTLSMVLTDVKGATKFEENYNVLKTSVLHDVFKELEVSEWFTVKNLEKYLYYHELDYLPANKNGVANYLYYQKQNDNYSYHEYVSGDNHQKMYVDAYLKGTIFLLASIGIFDMAYTKPDTATFGETYFTSWEGLYAFRMTALGAYLLGKTSTYKIAANADSTELFFDENELIILGKSDDRLTDTLLLNYVQKAGTSRYIVTSQTFLKDCKNPKQIKDKIALFKQTVGKSKLPDNWESFFDLLQERSNNIVKADNFQVFQLNASDKELIRLIAQEKSFQNIVFKAEGYKILVANDKVTSFRNKLKEWGYLLK